MTTMTFKMFIILTLVVAVVPGKTPFLALYWGVNVNDLSISGILL